mgnify:CR=1 FL=1
MYVKNKWFTLRLRGTLRVDIIGNSTFINSFDKKTNLHALLSHRCSTTVSLEKRNLFTNNKLEVDSSYTESLITFLSLF